MRASIMKSLWKEVTKALLFVGINKFVQVAWVLMELAVYGEARPSGIDTVIGLVLSWSLYKNLRHYVKFGEELS